jgi:predicted dehydrogenase
MTYSVAIFGLGNIGMLYDRQLPVDEFVLSHARAFSLHPDFELIAAAEPDAKLRDNFAQTYRLPVFPSVNELLAHVTPDVTVVASPTPIHGQIVDQILHRYKPRAILCEKPLAYESATARAMVDTCLSKQVPLYVNFIRRADPGVREIKVRLESRQISMPFKAIVWYSKGLLHNGSHFADLLTFWFGPIRVTKLIHPGRSWTDHDAEPDFQAMFDLGSAIFCAAREEDYSHYTVEVVAANGRLRYEQRGEISWQAAMSHPTLKGHRQLQPVPEIIGNDMNRYQYRVAEQLSLALHGAVHTLCLGASAVETNEWLEKVIGERTNSSEKHR